VFFFFFFFFPKRLPTNASRRWSRQQPQLRLVTAVHSRASVSEKELGIIYLCSRCVKNKYRVITAKCELTTTLQSTNKDVFNRQVRQITERLLNVRTSLGEVNLMAQYILMQHISKYAYHRSQQILFRWRLFTWPLKQQTSNYQTN